MSSASDFDFQIGDWTVAHRRLRTRLAGADDWETFPGSSSMRTILGGAGNVEDNLIHIPSGAYRASAIRTFDAAAALWAIWWLDMRQPHALDVPVNGRFENGTGAFFADDVFEGRPIRIRFLWLDTASGAPRWEQAFSADGGATWETNWTMQFVRA